MKKGFAILVLLAASFQAMSQEVESDDMYFSSRDRAKLNVLKTNTRVADEKKLDEDSRINSAAINPTDSYSARNINPEYISRSRSVVEDTTAAYFTNNYQPTSINRNLSNNSAYSNNFYSPYYGNYSNAYGYNGYGMYSPYSMYNPYSMYSPYSSMYGGGYSMFSPYSSFAPGWSLGLGYGMGSMFNGWYGNMGFGYGMPSSMFWNNFYSPYSYYGYYGYGSGWGYPGSVIVVNQDNSGRGLSYQRRYDRSSTINNTVSNTRPSSTTRTGRPIASSGRMATQNAQSQDYYQRGWRSNATTTSTSRSSFWNGTSSNSTSNSGRTRSWSSGGNSGFSNSGGFDNSGSRSSSWSNGGSRSSWSGGSNSFSGGSHSGGFGGGGSRSGGFSGGGGGGGGGGSRGRH